jgi:hypothetical protein
MRIFYAAILVLAAFTPIGYAKEVACSKENYDLEVEMKYLEYDKKNLPFYNRQFRPFPEEWSLAFPGLGKLRVKTAKQLLPAEKVKLEFHSIEGKVLATKELKLAESVFENVTYSATQSELEVDIKNFFNVAKEGKVKLSILVKDKPSCSHSFGVLGTLEQDE